MLKIYLKTIKHEIHNNNIKHDVFHESFYTIEDETCAEPTVEKYDLYKDGIQNAYYGFDIFDNKRGRVVYVYGHDYTLKFKQWKEPNAKLIKTINYREMSCSMEQLFKLPADKVIAYLKQEGIFPLTNGKFMI